MFKEPPIALDLVRWVNVWEKPSGVQELLPCLASLVEPKQSKQPETLALAGLQGVPQPKEFGSWDQTGANW